MNLWQSNFKSILFGALLRLLKVKHELVVIVNTRGITALRTIYPFNLLTSKEA